MTEDSKACDIILRTDHNAEDGIAKADSERRNFCWERVRGAAADDGACAVTVTYEDGRQEPRECVTLA